MTASSRVALERAAFPIGAATAKRRKPHVCFVAPYVWPVLARDPKVGLFGGAEVQQCMLARLLVAAGYRVSVISFDFGQPSPAEIDGITAYKAFRVESGLPVLRFLHPRLTRMWRVMRAVDADIYYQRSASVWTGIVAAFCRRHRRRSIYAGASDRDFELGQEQISFWRDRWIYRRGLAAVDRIVAQNAFQVESCRRHHAREAVLIPSCYQPPASARRATLDNQHVLWIGSIYEYKRPYWLLEMAERLPQRRFVMIGGASIGGRLRPGYFEAVQAHAARLPNVEFTGFLPLAETERWFDRARLVVSTSVYEGMPNVFLQAWARGVPVVSTVDAGASATRVFANVEDGARQIEALFTDELAWTRASGEALAHFRRSHSSEEVVARYARVFDELAE